MGNEKAIFKSMLVTKDGNYHKSYHLTINLKKRRKGRQLFLYRRSFFLTIKDDFFDEISPKKRAFR